LHKALELLAINAWMRIPCVRVDPVLLKQQHIRVSATFQLVSDILVAPAVGGIAR